MHTKGKVVLHLKSLYFRTWPWMFYKQTFYSLRPPLGKKFSSSYFVDILKPDTCSSTNTMYKVNRFEGQIVAQILVLGTCTLSASKTIFHHYFIGPNARISTFLGGNGVHIRYANVIQLVLLNWTPIFGWCVVRCGSKKQTLYIHMFKRDWITSSIFVHYSTFNGEHNWEDLYIQLRNKKYAHPKP